MNTPFALRLSALLLWLYPRLLGAILIFAAVQKILHPDAIRAVLRFDGLPEAAAWAVVVVEVVMGALLILLLRRWVLLACIILLAIYIAQISYLLIWHDAPSCACLEGVVAYEDARRSNVLGLIRNICLLLAAAWTWIQLPLPTHADA